MLTLLGVGTLVCCAAEPQRSLSEMLFQMASALGTVGLSVISTQATGELTAVSKLVLIVGMYVGRLGPLTFMFAVLSAPRGGRYEYPAEPVIIG
jgi:trk system potassium uptake protein TrkH